MAGTGTFDRRRIQAPELSRPLVYDEDAGPSRRRADDGTGASAGAGAAGEIFLKTGLITQANGSAYIESGNVKIACAVYGPRPKPPPYTPTGSLTLELKFAPFASRPRRAPLRDTEPAALSALLTQLLLPTLQLHLLPKSSVDVYVLVLESGGGGGDKEGDATADASADAVGEVLSAALSAAGAAVADAGVPMGGLGVGAGASSSSSASAASGASGASAGGIQIDRTKNAALALAPAVPPPHPARVTLGAMPALGKVTSLWMTGSGEVDEVCELIDTALQRANETHAIVAQAVLEGAEATL